MSIHLKDTIPIADDIRSGKNRRRAIGNFIKKLQALGLKEVFWSNSLPEDDTERNSPGGKIRLVTSKWNDRPAKRR